MLSWFQPHYNSIVNRLSASRLHHALLLVGAEGIGKMKLAEQLARVMLCKSPDNVNPCQQCQSCQLFAAGTHPDFHLLLSEKQIGVDLVRDGIRKLNQTAQLGGNKVLIIPAADSMTESAANALLKTLEEPTANTYLILTTSQLSRVLPTILSRCEKHALPNPTIKQSIQWLQQQGAGDVTPEQLQAYGNAPFKVKASLVEDGAVKYSDFISGLQLLINGDADETALAAKWQDEAPRVVGWCQHFVHEQYVKQQSQHLLDIYQVCITTKQHLLHPGINKKLVLSSLLAHFIHLHII